MRGTGLSGIYGPQSHESDAGIAPAARTEVTYGCDRGHQFTVILCAGAPIPILWCCRHCGDDAMTDADGATEIKEARRTSPVISHREQLRSRRTDAELEYHLAERLREMPRRAQR